MFFKKKEKEKEISFVRTWQNMFFALGIVWKCAPIRVICAVITPIVRAVLGFLSGTWLTRFIFNSLETNTPFTRIIAVVCGIYGTMLVFNVASTVFERVMTPVLKLRVARKLNHMLFSMVSKVDLSCYDDAEFYKKFTMTIPEAMGSIDNYAMFILNWFLDELTAIVTNASLIVVIDPFLIFLAVIPMAVNLIFGRIKNKVSYKSEMATREIGRDKDYVNRVFYLGDYAKEMRMSSIGGVMIKRFMQDLQKMRANVAKYGLKLTLFYLLTDCAVGKWIVYFTSIVYSAYSLLVTKTMPVGDCIVVSGTVTTLSNYLDSISDTYMRMRENAMFLDNMREFLAYEPKIKNTDAPKANRDDARVVFEDVTFRYDNTEKDVLHGLNFTIEKGEKIALVGANGAGKSTLVKLLMRLYDPTEGSVRLGGEDIRGLELDSYRDLFGVIFQDYRIFAMSVRDNVLLGDEGDDETVIAALKAAGVYERIMELPDGLDTMLTREYSEDGQVLSGGEYQKICVARVFARNAPIVILDEPSSALDPIAEYEMYENLLRMCEGRSAVFISHRLSSAVLADKVIMLENGVIIEMGSHAELMAKGGKYADMFAKQAENYIEGEDGNGKE